MELYAIGRIVGCFGIKGYMKIQPSTDSPDRFKELHHVYVGKSADLAQPLEMHDATHRRGVIIAAFRGVESRTDAESFRDSIVYVDDAEVRRPPEGRYFIHEVIGCEVVDEAGNSLGVVTDVYKLPAQDTWAIRGRQGEFLLPAVREFIVSVDPGVRKIVVHTIEGLIGEQDGA